MSFLEGVRLIGQEIVEELKVGVYTHVPRHH